MSAWLIAALSTGTYLVSTRGVFRFLVRREIFRLYPHECTCTPYSYSIIHRGRACHQRVPVRDGVNAAAAFVISLFLPVALAVAFVMHKPPLSVSDQAELDRDRDRRIQELERELGIGGK